jgi:hypothetical protein
VINQWRRVALTVLAVLTALCLGTGSAFAQTSVGALGVAGPDDSAPFGLGAIAVGVGLAGLIVGVALEAGRPAPRRRTT